MPCVLWRHEIIFIVGLNPIDQLAILYRSEHFSGSLCGIKPQITFAGLLVRSMTGEAVRREDWPDIPIEIHRWFTPCDRDQQSGSDGGQERFHDGGYWHKNERSSGYFLG